MKTIFIVCLICLSSVIAHTQGPTKDSNPDVDRLIALENAWNQAQLHHDAKALNDLVSRQNSPACAAERRGRGRQA